MRSFLVIVATLAASLSVITFGAMLRTDARRRCEASAGQFVPVLNDYRCIKRVLH
jgi:hypothetical protein